METESEWPAAAGVGMDDAAAGDLDEALVLGWVGADFNEVVGELVGQECACESLPAAGGLSHRDPRNREKTQHLLSQCR